jgi:hypothetical protein
MVRQPAHSDSADLQVLRRLLSLARKDQVQAKSAVLSPPGNGENDLIFLKKLLALKPQGPPLPRQTTLFDAMLVRNQENPHSDFIAWLLDPNGPLKEMWLTRLLFEHVAPDMPWPGTPTVEREVPCDEGRADILISWEEGFKIVIENKVGSPEGKGQIRCYLDGFGIKEKQNGRVIFLTPQGRKSKSKGEGADDLVVEMSYEHLESMVLQGLRLEESDRGKVFAHEFLACIRQLLRRSRLMEKIEIERAGFSEASKEYMRNVDTFSAIKQRAIEECGVFLQWMGIEAEKRLKAILGISCVATYLPTA